MKVIKRQKNSRLCIICGMDNDFGLKAPFYNMEDNSVASVVSFKTKHQSYPERTHGGMITALLDELMGRTLWAFDPETYGVTTTLNITFRRPVPLNTEVKARAYMTFDSARGFSAKSELFSMDNVLLAEGTCRYLKMKPEVAFSSDIHANEEMCYELPIDRSDIDFPPIKQ